MDVADKGVESASKSLTIIPTDDPLTIPKTTNSGAMLTTKKSGRQSPRLADEDGFLTPHSWFSWFLILLIPDFWCLILHSWFLIDWLPNDHCFGQAIWTDYNRSSRSRSPNALHFIKHDPFDYYAPFFFSLFVLFLFFWCSHSRSVSRSAISVWWRSLLLYLDMQLVTFNGMKRRNSVCALISTLGKINQLYRRDYII